MATATKTTWHDRLTAFGACVDAVEWACGHDTPEEAWAVCERGDWMLWIVGRMSGDPESQSRRRVILCACECARLALPHVRKSEDQPRKVIETAERWARGEDGVTLADVRAAYADAYAYAAADADAADAAYAAYAADAAAYAAAAAAYAADAAAADAVARAATLRQCANIVRKHFPVDTMSKWSN